MLFSPLLFNGASECVISAVKIGARLELNGTYQRVAYAHDNLLDENLSTINPSTGTLTNAFSSRQCCQSTLNIH
jgi:hypothetical protein